MKQFILFILITILVYLASFVMPWWISGMICFILTFLFNPGNFSASVISLIAVFIIWYLQAYMSDRNFDIPVSSLIGSLLGNISIEMVFIITGLVGGIPAAMAGLLGNWSRTIFLNK